MKFRTLIRRSLRFHWRSHLGVVLGAAIGSAALIGALVVGDSVKGSLRERALQRLGNVHSAMDTKDRFFETSLFDRMRTQGTNEGMTVQMFPSNRPAVIWGGHGSVALHLPASVTRQDGNARANAVQCYGVSSNFSEFYAQSFDLFPGTVCLNEALAQQLNARPGDRLIFRVLKPSSFSQDSSIAQRSDMSVALPLVVSRILTNWPGDFTLVSGQTLPMNAFLPIGELQRVVAREGRANLMLGGLGSQLQQPTPRDHLSHFFREALQSPSKVFQRGGLISVGSVADDNDTLAKLQRYLHDQWRLRDAEADLNVGTSSQHIEIRSKRIFLDPPITSAALAADANAQSVLTYLSTLLRAGTNAAPYSMVTAAGAPWTPTEMRDDEIVVSQWLAEDLRVKTGDEIALSYFLPESGTKLEEATNTFRVHGIVPMEMPWADRTLMPDFPGIEKAESTSEWDAGFPLTYEVRKKDDDYWKLYRGTPKAFITLAAGQKMWGNRFGNLTAIRFPIPTNAVGSTSPLTPALSPSEGEREKRSPSSGQSNADISTNTSQAITGDQSSLPLLGGEGRGEGERSTNSLSTIHHQPSTSPTTPHVVAYKGALEKKILANLKPEELGLRFEPVREQALKAAEQSQDFGGLFLGFSFFVIAAALLLMGMLFQFGLEQRASEIGTLLALGFTPAQVRKLFLREGVVLAFIGGVIGAVGGIYFAKAMLHGLTTIWRDAVGATALSFHVTGQTLVIGLFASVVVSTITIWLALRKFVKRSPRELLVGEIGGEESQISSLKPKVIAVVALFGALGLVGWTLAKGDTANAGAFFGAGALVLIAGLAFANAWLGRLSIGGSITLTSLAVRSCARRRKRSLATVAMLACGSFLIVSIGVFRLDANRDATQRGSGTGGFALIGETTMPVVQDLNSPSGRDFFALSEGDLMSVNVVPFRVRAGDEASCLNLNAAQKPRLLGVKPKMLEGRFAFAKGEGWQVLQSAIGNRQSAMSQRLLTSLPTNEIPAIGDANSIQWAMHKKVGDTIDYVDERGQPFKVRIVGAVANSILQGQLIIDEAEFMKHFPGESGYRMFLMDAPSNAVSQVSATLSRAMQDVGLELTPTVTRLNQFNAVQNTYLGTFQVLGGLGLLLGSVGLGIVVLRNVLERRGELAVMMAVGFRKATLQRLLLMENGALLLAGLALGVAAAVVAVLPALLSASGGLPVMSLTITLGAVLMNGVLWTWAATRFAVRGDLLRALRNE